MSRLECSRIGRISAVRPKNPETPFRTALKEDLLIGNWVLESKRTEILYKGYGRSKSGQKDKFPTRGGVIRNPVSDERK